MVLEIGPTTGNIPGLRRRARSRNDEDRPQHGHGLHGQPHSLRGLSSPPLHEAQTEESASKGACHGLVNKSSDNEQNLHALVCSLVLHTTEWRSELVESGAGAHLFGLLLGRPHLRPPLLHPRTKV